MVLAELKKEGECPEATEHRQVKYLNNVVEADRGQLKQLIRRVLGFKTLKTAYAMIKGFEVTQALRKGQAAIFNLRSDVRGEARIVERAFGIGPSALTEAVALLGQNIRPHKPGRAKSTVVTQLRGICATEPKGLKDAIA